MSPNNFRWSRELVALCVAGIVYGGLFLSNSIYAFDDTYLFGRFSQVIANEGHFGAALKLFFGADLPSEYRTYGLSRVLHYSVFLIFGKYLLAYEVFICASQIVTAVVVLKLAQFYTVEPPVALAAALTWLLVPFSLNWSFHHYTYALLPFQVLLFLYFYLVSNAHPHLGLMMLAGLASALTGELQLAAVPFAIVVAAVHRKGRDQSLTPIVVFAVAFVGSLVLHRLCWTLFFQSLAAPPRFAPSFAEWGVLAERSLQALTSIWRSVLTQVEIVGRSGYSVSLVVAGAAVLICASVLRSSAGYGNSQARFANLALLMTGMAASCFLIYIVLSATTGQIFLEMPRRYGLGALPLMSVAGVLFGALIFRLHQKLYALSVIFIVTAVAAQAVIVEGPSVRQSDRSVIDRASKALNDHGGGRKGVYLFVANAQMYEVGQADATTVGPLFVSLADAEFFQSPFALYWTAQSYFSFVLDAAFAAMPRPDDGRLGGNPGGRPSVVQGDPDGIVLANLRLSSLDAKELEAEVFESYTAFAPHKFYRKIDRDLSGAALRGGDELAIDIGGSENLAAGLVGDKAYGDRAAISSKWVSDYGYLPGAHGVYSHPGIGPNLDYYRTNRHGAMTYKISFQRPVRFEASFDFWEQWGRAKNERVFDLEVSWDEVQWVRAGRIDPAALNENKAFSVVISRTEASMMLFRLVPVKGDVPVIQGLRLRRL